FVSAQSGDTDKAKKIREAAIFTISFVACDSPSGNQLLWSIFKALRTFCAYQTLSFSCNAFRALQYIESLELHLVSNFSFSVFRSLYFLTSVAKMTSPAASAAFAVVPYSTFNSLHLGRSTQSIVGWLIRFWDSRNINKNGEFMGITILLLDELGFDLKNISATSRVVVRLLIELTVIVYLSLWDEAASTFRGLLKSGYRSQSVLLVTLVNPKLFGGNLYLNSTQGTRFFFDTRLPEVTEFVSRHVGATAAHTCVDTLEGIKKKELVLIGDLNSFISNFHCSHTLWKTQEADFLNKARIVCVNQENGWSFVSCTDCHKKIGKTWKFLELHQIFRVELAVDDGKDNTTFSVFDKEMSKLTKLEAAVLAFDAISVGIFFPGHITSEYCLFAVGAWHEGEEERLPGFLEELEEKEFVFQIRVIPFNFTPNHRTFTVSTITDDDTIANHVKEHFVGIPSNSEDNVGLAASSSGPPILGDKTGEECATETPPEHANAQKKCKCGSE
ncbi:LOW QUALITY PROTEIN: hypothetical protein HID58_019053, partial [Brassica napus]